MAALGIVGALVSLGSGIANWFSQKKKDKEKANQTNQLSKLLLANKINIQDYMRQIDEITKANKEEIKKDLGELFKTQASQLTRGLSQRRLIASGFGTEAQKRLAKTQAGQMGRALTGAEAAGLQAKTQAAGTLIPGQLQLQQQMQGLMEGAQATGSGALGAFTQFLSPVFQQAGLKYGEGVQELFNPKEEEKKNNIWASMGTKALGG